MCDFVAWPKSKTAEIALVCHTPWQPPPANHQKSKWEKQKVNNKKKKKNKQIFSKIKKRDKSIFFSQETETYI